MTPRPLSIRNLLALVLCGAALLAFAVAGAGLALFDRLTLEDRARHIMEPYAQLVSVGAEAAVTFGDPLRAQEILNTLRANPEILAASLVLANGRVLAGYGTAPPAAPWVAGLHLKDNTAVLNIALQQDARLSLTMNLDRLGRQSRQALWMFGAFMLVMLAITIGQLAVLQPTIIRPIAHLAEAAEQVRTRGDYRLHLPAATATHEVARLSHSFAAMMAAVHEREDDLRRLTLFQRTLLDNAAYAIVSTTPEGVVNSFNPAAERLLGYTAAETVGQKTPAYWHDPQEMERRALERSRELGETVPPGFAVFTARTLRHLPEECEWTLVRKDGARLPVLMSVTAMRDELGRVSGFVSLIQELTARNKAEQALREKTAELDLYFTNSLDLLCIADTDGFFRRVNPAWQTTLGYTVQELEGRKFLELVHPDDIAATRDEVSRLSDQKAVLNFSNRYRGKDGTYRWVEWRAFPAGKLIYASARDITERKRAEEALKHRETHSQSLLRLSRALERAQNYSEVIQAALEEVRATIGYQALVVYQQAEDQKNFKALAAAGPITDALMNEAVLPALAPADDKTPGQNPSPQDIVVIADARTDPRIKRDLAQRHGIGTLVHIPIILFDRHPGTVGMCTLGDKTARLPTGHERDYLLALASHMAVSLDRIHSQLGRRHAEEELRASQALYRSFVDQLPNGVFRKNREDRYVMVNPRFCQMKGLRAEEFLGRTPLEVARSHAQNHERAEQVIKYAAKGEADHELIMRTGKIIVTEEEYHDAQAGKQYVDVIRMPVFDQEGRIVGTQGILFDVTARKLAEAAIRKLNRELEQRVADRTVQLEATNKELEAFAYSVSHDLRAPLRSIDGFSQALLEDYAAKLDRQGQHYLERVRAAAQRMAQLIDDMLNLSRVTRGELQMEQVNLSDLAGTIAAEITARDPARSADITIAPDLVVTGDTRFLRVALENLLSNAWKFTSKRDTAKIAFGLTVQDGHPVFFIRDNGAGFDMKYAGRLFGAFQRLHTADEFPGTGVGLATVQRIINRHGGQVWAQSEVDRGTTLYFTLPDRLPAPSHEPFATTTAHGSQTT